jgi:hypothetical protein
MKTRQSDAATNPARSSVNAAHALVLIAIFTIFAIAIALSLIVPQALDIAATHSNSARPLAVDAEELANERREETGQRSVSNRYALTPLPSRLAPLLND